MRGPCRAAGALALAVLLSIVSVANVPRAPRHQLLAADHNYGGLSPCASSCRAAILATRRRVPALLAEPAASRVPR